MAPIPLLGPARAPAALSIMGFVDGVFRGDVSGWIINHDEPARLEEIVCRGANGQISFHAFRHNQAVNDAVCLDGRFGFSIPMQALRHLGPSVQIGTRHGDLLERGLIDMRDYPQEVSSLWKDALVFLHIPKTAGTSVTTALSEALPVSASGAVYHQAPWLSAPEFASLFLHERKALRFVYGHLTFGFHYLLGQTARYATFLRDPMERIASHYWHMRRTNPYPIIAGQKMAHSTIVNRALVEDFDNIQARMLAGIYEGLVGVGAVSDSVVDLALYNIDEYFDFIGFYNSIEADFRRLCALLDVPARHLPPCNIIQRGSSNDSDFNKLDWDRIAHNNRFDIGLYDRLRSA